jgi:uncharacterized protein (DUF58 family)
VKASSATGTGGIGAPQAKNLLRLPRRLRVTPEGKGFLLLALGTGAAAVNTGNNLLHLALSMTLSLVVLSGILSERCLRGVSVRIRHASPAFARRNALLAVTCAAGRRFPALSISVTLDLPGGARTVRFPFVPAGGTATRVVSFHPPRRGAIVPVRCAVSTLFPFALFDKRMDIEAQERLLVYPEPLEDAPHASREPCSDFPGAAASPGRQGSQIRGVRDRLPADPVRDIHWKASARLAKWVVKEREGELSPVCDIRIEVARPASETEFERALSRACALVLRWEREGRPYRLWLGNRLHVDVSSPNRRARALSVLALAGPDDAVNGP